MKSNKLDKLSNAEVARKYAKFAHDTSEYIGAPGICLTMPYHVGVAFACQVQDRKLNLLGRALSTRLSWWAIARFACVDKFRWNIMSKIHDAAEMWWVENVRFPRVPSSYEHFEYRCIEELGMPGLMGYDYSWCQRNWYRRNDNGDCEVVRIHSGSPCLSDWEDYMKRQMEKARLEAKYGNPLDQADWEEICARQAERDRVDEWVRSQK